MTVYYNENDKRAAAWLRELIAQGQLPAGVVDERSIEDVTPNDLRGFTQCHFFAGIGGWALALQWAGWGEQTVWTGSCPCQPFSAAGKGGGFADERHLWPAWFHLIEQCRPGAIFGEQVASPDGLLWFDLVQSDLQGASYACAGADLCAAGIGAPHIRQRLYWVAYASCAGLSPRQCDELRATGWGQQGRAIEQCGGAFAGGLGDADGFRVSGRRPAEAFGTQTQYWGQVPQNNRVEHAVPRLVAGPRPLHQQWANADWLLCRDGKWRPVEPGTFPLADGLPGRVGLLRGYGNAIVPQLAEQFIRAAM